MAFDIILLYFLFILLPTGYAWSVFHSHLLPLDFLLLPSFFYFFPALQYLSGDTLCLHLLCLDRVILSLHMLCLFRVWDFDHQVGSRESVRMNSICGSHQGKNGLHCQICIAVDFIHIEGVKIYAPHGEILNLCSSYPALVYRVSENTSRPGHGSGVMSVFILSATCVINMIMRDWIELFISDHITVLCSYVV